MSPSYNNSEKCPEYLTGQHLTRGREVIALKRKRKMLLISMVTVSLLVFGGIGAIAKASGRTATTPTTPAAQQVQGSGAEKTDNASESEYGTADEKAAGAEQADTNEADENLPGGGHADPESANADHQFDGVE